jgi:MFS-type transporter involved in bile tolerance (Atg22 family)
MMNKITTLLGSIFAGSFLVGLATTLTRSSMIGFFDVLPVFILMAIAILMMVYEAFFDKN